MSADQPLVLGLETSCDETGVGIVRGAERLVDAIASSVDAHARFGGVVPEVASRAHLEAMVPTIERATRREGPWARPRLDCLVAIERVAGDRPRRGPHTRSSRGSRSRRIPRTIFRRR